MQPEPCSCGEAAPHVVAQRHTFDGVRLLFWSDGDVTSGLSYRIRGLPRLPLAAMWALAGQVGILTLAEACDVATELRDAARRAPRRERP